jgi:hypothetical protein
VRQRRVVKSSILRQPTRTPRSCVSLQSATESIDGSSADLFARSMTVQALNRSPWSEWMTVPRLASRCSLAA